MGKFAVLRNKLQRFTDETPWGVKVDELKQELVNEMDKTAIAEKMKKAKNRKKKLEKIDSKLNLLIEASERALAETLEASGEEKFTLSSGGSFFIQDKVYPVIEDKAAFNHWAMSNGYENDFNLHHKKIESIVNEHCLNGLPLPDGVRAFIKVGIGVRNVLEKE